MAQSVWLGMETQAHACIVIAHLAGKICPRKHMCSVDQAASHIYDKISSWTFYAVITIL